MKKLVGFILASSIFAFAATSVCASYSAVYDGSDNKISIADAASSYKTVLITDENNTIVYVDENDSTFGAAVNFLLKSNPSDGYYTVKLGSDASSASATLYFAVCNNSNWLPEDVAMTFVEKRQDGEKYKMAWYIRNFSIDGYNSLKIAVDNNSGTAFTAGYDLEDTYGIFGSGSVSLGFRMDGIPGALADENIISVYLSPDKVSSVNHFAG